MLGMAYLGKEQRRSHLRQTVYSQTSSVSNALVFASHQYAIEAGKRRSFSFGQVIQSYLFPNPRRNRPATNTSGSKYLVSRYVSFT